MKKIPALILIVLILSSVAMASTWEITTGTQFITSNNLTVEWLSDAGPSKMLSGAPNFTANSIKFYNTNFSSTSADPVGSVGIYHNQINGTVINMTSALGVGKVVSVNTTVQDPPISPFSFSGNGLTLLNMSTQINGTDEELDFSFASNAAGSMVTLTVLEGPPTAPAANTTFGAIDMSSGIGYDVNTTDADGVLILDNLPNTAGVTKNVRISPLGFVEIRSEQEPYPTVGANVEVIFYEELPLADTTIPIVTNRTTDADGRIDFTDIPDFGTREFLLQVREGDAPGYFPRVVLIPSLLEQSTIYLVPTNAARGTVSTTVQISDQTGSFSGEADDVTLYISKAIRRADFDSNITEDNPFRWEIVTSERVNNALNLNQSYIYSDRYKVRISNAAGDTRELGAWVADRDNGLQLLSVQLFNITSPDVTEGYQANATFNDNNAILFGFTDTEDKSSSLIVNITSLYNSTHPVIYSASACPLTCGEFITNATGSMSAEDLAQAPFKVSWSVVRTDLGTSEYVGGSFVLGPNTLTASPDVSQHTKNIFVVGILIVLGGTVAALSSPGLAILTLVASATLFMLANLLDPLIGIPVLLVGVVVGVITLYRGRGG